MYQNSMFPILMNVTFITRYRGEASGVSFCNLCNTTLLLLDVTAYSLLSYRNTMSNLKLSDVVLRPSSGTSGTKIKVRANFYEVTHLPQINVIHYDVTIEPDMPPTMNRKVWKHFEDTFDTALGGIRPVYDGKKNLFSPKKLPFGDAEVFDVILPEEHGQPHQKFPRKFKIKIKIVAKVVMAELQRFLDGKIGLTNNCLTAITVLDILVRHKPSMLHTTVGRSFFTSRNARPLPDGLEAWGGWYQSVRPTPGKMMINVDVSTTAFYQAGPLLTVIARILKVSPNQLHSGINDKQRNKLDKIFKSVNVKMNHRGEGHSRKYRISKFTKESAGSITFHNDSLNKTQTVTAYFLSQYNIRLEYPNMPCIVVQKNTYLPVELCEIIPGQRSLRKHSREQTSEMIKFAASPPTVRASRIQDGANELAWKQNAYIQGFGLQVTTQPMTIDARILKPPKVHFAAGSRTPSIVPKGGAWNLMGVKVAVGASLGSWAIAVFNEKSVHRQIENFVREMVLVFRDTGMNVVNREPVIRYYNPQKGAEGSLKEAFIAAGESTKAKPQILLCVLPDTGVDLYADIKRVSDTVLGIPTQCMQLKHTEFPKKQYCANVCLKVNLKLGGMNSFLDPQDMPFIAQKPTIVFGADVTHPGPGEERKPSIAALCASLDAKASRYCATIRLQKPRTEVINDLEGMVKLLMKNFYQKSGNKPARILFYRDGVSESQFKEVVETEVEAIKAACRNLDAKYNPPITFVLVQKRHHARFFGIDKCDMDRGGNINPGLVVDQMVTHPFEFDFYLQSHAGLQGTCRPTHYQVLFDENRFTSDQIQELTYKLCYTYGRATRSVSVVPAAYYADIVAARARFHFYGEHFSDTGPSTASDAGAKPLRFGNLHQDLLQSMYFI
ncbi:Piwi domain-containing protein [Endogone sp. FLAS-F59071]|nr:Piwi domain-containing protein [Endogone sp. FLAS-F59071]|eukprot:RUS16005.1 Piwi domain-containing protein [Endogone sp. FLAS-F59071]